MGKGSEWRKWDLHFHTPSSYDYKGEGITNQEIVDLLVQKQIAVVAITDHHLMDIGRIKELQSLGKTKNVTVLPGIEFLSDTRGDEPVHFIAIFSEVANIDFIWKQIQSRTAISRIEGEGMKINEVYCHLLETAKLIRELGGITTIHAGNKSNSIENITNSLPHGTAQKIDIAEVIDVFELGKETDLLPYNKLVIPFLKKKLDKHIPMIICTDNHNIKNYVVKQNLWIKADPTFEGLKHIIFEPEYRVRIQEEKPDFKEEKLVIDQVRFISSDKFNSHPIYLNDNLNVIIGGKSSGKSILLYSIAKTLLADKEFLRREKIEDKYNFRNEDLDFNFEITTRGGFKQLLYRDEKENSIIPEIKYIPQNYLIRLAEPAENKTGNALNKIVRELINEDHDSMLRYDDFISKVKSNDRRRESLVDVYFDIRDRIVQLEGQLKLTANREILEGNINSNTKKVDQLNQSIGMSADQIAAYNNLQANLEKINQLRSKANNDYKKIIGFNEEVKLTLTTIIQRSRSLSNSLENDQLKRLADDHYELFIKIAQASEQFNSRFLTTKEEATNNILLVDGPVSDIFRDLRLKEEQIKTDLLPFINNEAIKRQIENINKSINEDKGVLQMIDRLVKELENRREELNQKRIEIFTFYEENYNEYLKVIDSLKSRTLDLEKDGLKIEGVPAFNFPKFKKAVVGFSDGRSASYAQYKICEERDSLFSYDLNELTEEMKLLFESIVNSSFSLTSKTSVKNAVKQLLEDYFFDYWQIEYKGDKLGKMSTGKASFVILMLIVGLSKSKAPILIDQPEDNLDNRSITNDLVEYLKKKKIERQIILVTHNANVVVNADAENIIIAHQIGQDQIEDNALFKFDYINGALENTFLMDVDSKNILTSMGIREHIADIVEGGKVAFKKREEKYGFSKKM